MERTKPGRARITEALLALLEDRSLDDISVVDLCAVADVSRSTFYAHFSNVADVYCELVRELVLTTSAIQPQLRCADCTNSNKQPLCELLRPDGKYHNLTNEERFMRTYIDIGMAELNDETTNVYHDVCTDKDLAYALFCFQMMGCIGAAKTMPESTDWNQVRPVLDAFIRGGLHSVRSLNLS